MAYNGLMCHEEIPHSLVEST